MEKNDKDYLQTFDALYTTNQIQIMKILLPYCSPDSRRGLAVMIKFMEFDYTLRLTRSHPENKKLLSSPGTFHARTVPVHTECHADV